MAEPRLELRRAALRHRAAPWREVSQNSRTSASSTCTEDEGRGGGPCWPAFPRVWLPCATLPNAQPLSYYWALWRLQKIPQWKPQHASKPSALPGTGRLPRAVGLSHQYLCWWRRSPSPPRRSRPQRSSGLGSAAGLSVSCGPSAVSVRVAPLGSSSKGRGRGQSPCSMWERQDPRPRHQAHPEPKSPHP